MIGIRAVPGLVLCAIALTLTACGGGSGDALLPPPSNDLTPTQLAANCTALKGQVIAGVTVTGTSRAEAGGNLTSGVCQVLGTRAPYLDIEVDVPDNWSGRIFHQGGSGFDGVLSSGVKKDATGNITSVSQPISDKAAVYAASNGGSRSGNPIAPPPAWAGNTPQSQQAMNDFSYQALGATIFFAKAVAKQIQTKKAITKTYFNGCSNGGRNAYSVAERLPLEYDGIVSGCEGMDMGNQSIAWLRFGSVLGTPAALTKAQYTASYSAAVAACDANDGVTDGWISNPDSCHLDPALLVCGASGANPDPTLCLSSAQAAWLTSLMTDVTTSGGQLVYSRFNWADFGQWAVIAGSLGGGFAWLGTGDPTWMDASKQQALNIDRDWPVIKAGLMSAGADHVKSAVAAYIASGRKLISYHTAADNMLSPNEHARNFATMTQFAQDMGLADPRSQARLFTTSHWAHSAGSSLAQVDWFSAIVDWVENGAAPTQLEYKFTQGSTARALPVCEYPKYPRYNGSGDKNASASYTCTAP